MMLRLLFLCAVYEHIYGAINTYFDIDTVVLGIMNCESIRRAMNWGTEEADEDADESPEFDQVASSMADGITELWSDKDLAVAKSKWPLKGIPNWEAPSSFNLESLSRTGSAVAQSA